MIPSTPVSLRGRFAISTSSSAVSGAGVTSARAARERRGSPVRIRADLDARGAAAVIPSRTTRKGRFDFDRDMYRWRHLIENTFAKLKEFRAVATRYDKTDTSYAATVHLAAAIIASR